MNIGPKTMLYILAFALILFSASNGYAAVPAYETKTPQIRVALSQSSVQVGDTFEAAFWLQGYLGEYSGIEGFEFQAVYDPERIQPVLETDSSAFQSGIFTEDARPITWINSIDRSGAIKFAQSLPPQSARGHFAGSGKIGVISFKALKEGSASITLQNTIIIKPGNPGVNIKHSFNSPSIAIGAVQGGGDKLTTIGSNPKITSVKRSTQEMIRTFMDEPEFAKVPWAQEAIASLTEYGAIKGMPNGEFNPMKPMTRAEFAQLAVMALGLDMQQHSTPTFSDLHPSDWFYDAVETASAGGMIDGYETADGEKKFQPHNGITRAEIASILSKYLTLAKKQPSTGLRAEPAFRDVPASHWARPYINNLYQWGIVNGKAQDQFDPDAPITRAEVSILLHNLLLLG